MSYCRNQKASYLINQKSKSVCLLTWWLYSLLQNLCLEVWRGWGRNCDDFVHVEYVSTLLQGRQVNLPTFKGKDQYALRVDVAIFYRS